MIGRFAAEPDTVAVTRSINPAVARALAATAPRSLAEVAAVYGRLLAQVEQLWQDAERRAALEGRPAGPLPVAALESVRQVFHGPDSPFHIAKLSFEDLELLPDRPSQARLQELRGAVQKWLTSGPGAPARALSVEESSTPTESRVFVRGNPNNPGELAPRRFLVALAGARRTPFPQKSGTSRAGECNRLP